MEGNSKASLEGTSEGRAREDRRQHSSVELSSSNSDGDGICRVRVRSVTSKDAQLEATKSEMGEVRKENERLRMQLDRMIKDYHALQEQFQGAARKQNDTIIPAASATNQPTTPATDATSESHPHRGLEEEETELVSLSLGRKTSIDLQRSKVSQGSEKDGLALGLRDYKLFQGSESDARADGFHVPGHENVTSSTEEVAPSGWPPQKILKRREGNEPPHPSNGKRARVCLRIRCETPTMNDGCLWRKYGQKIAKGNPCPRAYYRCTVAPACPVRKQVQRCAEDMSILIITYEGTHNHPLPISATGMASTTAAAASMLLSGPSSTLTNPSTSRPSPPLNGLSFHAPHSISNIQLPITSSSSNPNPNTNPNHQTITLDLTTSNNTFTPSQSPHFNLFPKSSISFPTQYSSRPTSLDFSSSSPNSLRGNSGNTMFNYSSLRANTSSNHINQFATSSTIDHHSSFHQSTMQRNNTTDTINSAIMSDPSFQSALAAALTTIIGGGDGQLQGMISGLQSGSSTRGLNNSIGLLHASSSGSRPTMTSPGAALANSASTSPSDNIKEHSI